MSINNVVDYIFTNFSNLEQIYLEDAIVEAAIDQLNLDEYSALEYMNKNKTRIVDKIRSAEHFSSERSIPPKILIENDVVKGNFRPSNMDDIWFIIRNVRPFDFQKIVCLYTRRKLRYYVTHVYRQNGGADLLAEYGEISLAIQSRRHIEGKIGITEIQTWERHVRENFAGAALYFISSSLYTSSAIMYSREKRIILVDGEQMSYFLSNNYCIITNQDVIDILTAERDSCSGIFCEIR